MATNKQRQQAAKSPPSPPTPPLDGNNRRVDWTAIVALIGVIISSSVAVAVAVWTTQGAFDSKMVEIGVSILSADPGKDVVPARQWAITLVELHSGHPFEPSDREKLLRHPIQTYLRGATVVDYTDCAQWKHNSDGSWTTVGKISMPNGSVLDSVTLGGGLDTLQLDRKCGKR